MTEKQRKLSQMKRLWLWLFGVMMPLHTIVFEWQTHQMSGTMFDPLVTPWHAGMLLALPVGVGLMLLTPTRRASAITGVLGVSLSLPFLGLIVWAIGLQHLIAILQLVSGIAYVLVHPSQWADLFFGDYYMSPIAALAYLGSSAGFGTGLVLVLRNGGVMTMRIVVPTVLLAASSLIYLESGAIALNRAIAAAYQSLEAGRELEPPSELTTDQAKSAIARLSRPGQQFSSHGSLYAVGPVDVFGPWTYVRQRRLHPVALLYQTKWPDYSKLHEAIWPGETPEPHSWRGLSPWETQTP